MRIVLKNNYVTLVIYVKKGISTIEAREQAKKALKEEIGSYY